MKLQFDPNLDFQHEAINSVLIFSLAMKCVKSPSAQGIDSTVGEDRYLGG